MLSESIHEWIFYINFLCSEYRWMDFVVSVLQYDHDRYIFISDQSISRSNFHHFSSEIYSGYKSVEKQYDIVMKYNLVFRMRNVEFSNESLVDVIARLCNEYLLFHEKKLYDNDTDFHTFSSSSTFSRIYFWSLYPNTSHYPNCSLSLIRTYRKYITIPRYASS